jgi:outer membrane protein assembly complex protein YaeT
MAGLAVARLFAERMAWHARGWAPALVVGLGVAAAQTQPQVPGPAAQPDASMRFEDRIITEIRFEPIDQPYPPDVLTRILPIKAGDRFNGHTLEGAIQKLSSTGRYADIAVDGTLAADGEGMVLKFVTKRAYFVGRVEVVGVKDPPNEGQLVSASKLELGAPFHVEDRETATESIENLLRRNGFYHARVNSNIEYENGAEQAQVTFLVDSGKRAHYEQPIIAGTPRRPLDKIVRSTHWHRIWGWLGWQPVTDSRTQAGANNVRSYYQKKDLLLARVSLRGLDYHEQTNTVQPALQIGAGPEVMIQVTGVKIPRGTLKQLVPIYQERTMDTDLIVEGRQNIESYLQSKGYFEADVDYSLKEDNDRRTITYNVNLGAKHYLVRLTIRGNAYFPVSTIRERMLTLPAQFPRYPYGRYSEATVNADLEAIRELYRTNGFQDVKVDYVARDNYGGRPGHLELTITIDEGVQWLVAGVAIEGVPQDEANYFYSTLISSKGQPYSAVNVAADRDYMLNYYYNRGYPDATFDYYMDSVDLPNRVKLRFRLTPGKKRYVRQVLVSGLKTTKRHLVYDRIQLHEGDPLSLEKNTDTQRALYDLGIFARVNTALQNPDGEEDSKYVLYQLDEAHRYSMTFGGGAQLGRIGGGVTTFDDPAGSTGFVPRGTFGISRINFLGLGETIGLNSTISTVEQRASLTYFAPHLSGSKKFTLTLNVLFDDASDIRTFTSHRREVSAQVGHKLSKVYTIQYRLVFRRVTESDLKIDPSLVPILAQPDRTGLLGISVIRDTRDDPVDAHHGAYTTVDMFYASRYLGSETQFGRFLARNSTYYKLTRNLVFARSTQFGVIETTQPGAVIPLPERFFSGGAESMRAFPDNQAGPRDLDTGFPLGGGAILMNNLELRFPLFGDNLGGVLFIDSGNVYDDLHDVDLRFRQRNLQDFDYMVQSAGIGFRYRTPIGPIRLDLSFSPDAPRFFGFKGTEQQLIDGQGIATVQKINAFQFHFSLGQAF